MYQMSWILKTSLGQSLSGEFLLLFWGSQGQRSQGYFCMQKYLVITLSQEPIDGLAPILGHIYVSCKANELIRIWDHEMKGQGANFVCKNSL